MVVVVHHYDPVRVVWGCLFVRGVDDEWAKEAVDAGG